MFKERSLLFFFLFLYIEFILKSSASEIYIKKAPKSSKHLPTIIHPDLKFKSHDYIDSNILLRIIKNGVRQNKALCQKMIIHVYPGNKLRKICLDNPKPSYHTKLINLTDYVVEDISLPQFFVAKRLVNVFRTLPKLSVKKITKINREAKKSKLKPVLVGRTDNYYDLDSLQKNDEPEKDKIREEIDVKTECADVDSSKFDFDNCLLPRINKRYKIVNNDQALQVLEDHYFTSSSEEFSQESNLETEQLDSEEKEPPMTEQFVIMQGPKRIINLNFYGDNAGKKRKTSRRSRLPRFLPKRYFWDMDEIDHLGYYWFDGAVGREIE